MHTLAHRLQRVRITCGDWRRVLTPSASRAATGGDGHIAVFLDPPYATSGDLYAHNDRHATIAANVQEWCTTAPNDMRIILCGYDNEHDALLNHGWTVTQGKAGGGSGYSNNPGNHLRERLWLSPACNTDHTQDPLFEVTR